MKNALIPRLVALCCLATVILQCEPQVAHAGELSASFIVSVKVRNACKITLDTITQLVSSKCSIDETSSTATAGALSSVPTPTKFEVSHGTIEEQHVEIRTIIF